MIFLSEGEWEDWTEWDDEDWDDSDDPKKEVRYQNNLLLDLLSEDYIITIPPKKTRKVKLILIIQDLLFRGYQQLVVLLKRQHIFCWFYYVSSQRLLIVF